MLGDYYGLAQPWWDNFKANVEALRQYLPQMLPRRVPAPADLQTLLRGASRQADELYNFLRVLSAKASEGHRATWRMLDEAKRMKDDLKFRIR